MAEKIKSISIKQFDYLIRKINDEELDIEGHDTQYTEFDPDGRPLKEIKYMQDGTFEEMIAYEYNEAGSLARELYYPAEDEVAEDIVYFRDDTGRITKAIKNYQDGSVDTIDYLYNDAGQLIKKIVTDDDGDVEQTDLFEYENDQLVKHEVYNADGELQDEPFSDSPAQNEVRISQNEAGQVTLEEELNDEGEVIMSIGRTYNPDGRPDEVEVFIDGQGRRISRHYILKYEYTYFN